MIYYFSGTGNSRYVAETLSNLLGLVKKFIPATEPGKEIETNEDIGFVFPVYSWGVPPLVLEFIEKLPDSLWETLEVGGYRLWCVMSCGDEVAMAPEMLQKSLKKRGVKADGIWSIIMPNNYVLLPGFNVDSKEIEKKKLDATPPRLLEIAEAIRNGVQGFDIVRGSIPRIKTRLVYPLFKRWGINTGKWHYTASCVGCGKCVTACPLHNVEMKERHPQWGDSCCSCLACYHVCPYHAVEYGKETIKKGQYMFPKL